MVQRARGRWWGRRIDRQGADVGENVGWFVDLQGLAHEREHVVLGEAVVGSGQGIRLVCKFFFFFSFLDVCAGGL